MTLSVLVNVKLTAGIYSLMILCGYMALLWMNDKAPQLRRLRISAAAGFFIGSLYSDGVPTLPTPFTGETPFTPLWEQTVRIVPFLSFRPTISAKVP